MELHPYYQDILDAYADASRPAYHESTPVEARAMLRATMAATPAPTGLPEMESVVDCQIDGPNGAIALRIYTPVERKTGVCVYFHAGGWVIGDLDFSDATCRRLCAAAGCVLVSADYRLAPEHPYPQPLDDAFAALEWAAAQYPGRVVVAGESAGGNLAAACAIRARARGGPSIAGQWMAYPVTDHACDTASHQDIGERNLLLSTADMKWFWNHYCPPGIDRSVPELSPLRASDAAGLPPAMIVVAELDPLRDEGLAYAARLAGAGVAVTTRCDPGVVHGYLGAAAAIAAAAEAVAESGRWIRARLDGQGLN